MAKYRCGGGGSPDIVNGVIEEYLAESEDISANTFVEFVRYEYMHKLDTSTWDATYQTTPGRYIFSYKLSNNRVLLVCGYYLSSTGGTYLTFILLGIDNNSITQLCHKSSDAVYGVRYAVFDDIAVLSENSVMFPSSPYNGNASVFILSITDTTLTIGTKYIVTDSYKTVTGQKLVKLSDSKVLNIFKCQISSWDYRLKANVLTISGDTISVSNITGTPLVSASSDTQMEWNMRLVSLSATQVILLYNSGDTNHNTVNQILINVNETTITFVDNGTVLSGTTYTYLNKVMNCLNSDKYYGYGVIDNIRYFFIFSLANGVLKNESSTHIPMPTECVCANDSMVYCFGLLNGFITSFILSISGTVVTIGDSSNIAPNGTNVGGCSTGRASCFGASAELVFFPYASDNTNYYVYMWLENPLIYHYPPIKKAESSINGISKTLCTKSANGKIWVLK